MRTILKKLHKLTSKGDTIVEVLLAVGVISFTLVTAYAISSRSMDGIRTSQERQEALALAQSQIELVRQNLGLDSDTKGCFDESNNPVERGGDACKFRGDGTSGCTNADAYCYLADITKSADGAYQVRVSWENASASQSEVSLWYRPPFGLASAAAGGGGAGGNASIGSDPLPCDPTCTHIPPAGGHYQFSRRLKNLSVNDPANVRACQWDWGDGTVDIYPGTEPACQLGGYSQDHHYTPTSGLPPYPGACYLVPGADAYRVDYTVKLTVDLYSGGQGIDTYTFGLPDCVP
ncbi:hypothetical protein EYC59_03930 [Candidatus Saccharibacteria bacterium]|nr:MAG: hypothetical protein EYC59_03930 [Candidatus Saccharibacteria bacterium]